MNNTIIEIKNISKRYKLGIISTGTLHQDLSMLWSRFKGNNLSNVLVSNNDLKSYSNLNYTWALKDVNLKIERGEILGIIGNNGAGKSTLLKILSRITSPTLGEIKVKGKLASLLEVGTGFHPELTGIENIYLNGSILGMSKKEIKNQLEEIIDFSGINKYIDTPVKRYSTGMRVRLGFSVAAHLNPDILLIDEVLAVGDASFQKRALGKISSLTKGGDRTTIFVSHNLQAIKSITSKCVLIHDGKIVYNGQTQKAIDKYLSNIEKDSQNNLTNHDNPYLELKDIQIKDENLKTRETFSNLEDIFIIFEYQLKQKIDKLRICFKLVDPYGTIIFNTADFLDGNRLLNIQNSGRYISSCKIPGELLNIGRYSLTATADIPFKKIVYEFHDIRTFNVIFTERQTGSFDEKFEGIIFPNLKWNTKKIN